MVARRTKGTNKQIKSISLKIECRQTACICAFMKLLNLPPSSLAFLKHLYHNLCLLLSFPLALLLFCTQSLVLQIITPFYSCQPQREKVNGRWKWVKHVAQAFISQVWAQNAQMQFSFINLFKNNFDAICQQHINCCYTGRDQSEACVRASVMCML